MLPKPFTHGERLSAAAATLDGRVMQAAAAVCAGARLHPARGAGVPLARRLAVSLRGLFVFAVLGAAWFGGAGPGFLAAVLGTLTLPQLITVSYPLLGGFLDLPRFITFSIVGLAVGWGSSRRARKLREQERYARAMEAGDDGFWDWIPATDRSTPRPGCWRSAASRPARPSAAATTGAEVSVPSRGPSAVRRGRSPSISPAGRCAHDIRCGFIRDGETRWVHLSAWQTRDPAGACPLDRNGADITEQKRVEEALRESEERFALAVAGSYDGVWDIDFVARSVFFSARTRELCGLPPGPEVVPLDGWFEALPLHPEDRPRRIAAVEAHLSGKAPAYEGEFRFLQPDGVYRWRHLHGVCVRDAGGKPLRMAGSISDVDARRRAEEALRESEQRYELAMAASESGYWDWHIPTDRYFASPRAFELGGYPPGTTWVNREEFRARINMHPEDFARWEAAREELFAGTGERLAMEVRYIVRGETRWHSLQAICRRDDTGKVIRWTGSTTDVTERKRAEEGLRTMERKLRQAQRLEAMGTLAGGIAHDFNNILGAILGYGEMALRDAPKGSRLARDLDSIMVAGERGRALVERVLAFSRSAVGERVPVHVERVVREVLDLVLAKLPASVTVHPKLHAGPAAVLGDATQVHQVVANLATNAIQAMPAGGTLRVELAIERVEAPRAATIGGLRGWRVCRAYGRGYRRRHRAGDRRSHLRPLFHHQGSRHRHRPGTFARARHRHRARWRDRCREYPRHRQHVHHLPAAFRGCRGAWRGKGVGPAARRGPARAGRRRRGAVGAACDPHP